MVLRAEEFHLHDTMKFGKKIHNIVLNSVPSWQPHFLNYKALKQCVKPGKAQQLPSSSSVLPQLKVQKKVALCGCGENRLDERDVGNTKGHANDVKGEVGGDENKVRTCHEVQARSKRFLDLLGKEVDKVNEFYLEKEEDVIIQYELLDREVRRMLRRWKGCKDEKKSESVGSVDEGKEVVSDDDGESVSSVDSGELGQVKKSEVMVLMRMLVNLHAELVLLENFCTVNYVAVAKILKKHDKKTGLRVRGPYLKVVSTLPFLNSSTVDTISRKIESQMSQMEGVG